MNVIDRCLDRSHRSNKEHITTIIKVVLDQGVIAWMLTTVASVRIPDTLGIQIMTLIYSSPPKALYLARLMVLTLDQSRLIQFCLFFLDGDGSNLQIA